MVWYVYIACISCRYIRVRYTKPSCQGIEKNSEISHNVTNGNSIIKSCEPNITT